MLTRDAAPLLRRDPQQPLQHPLEEEAEAEEDSQRPRPRLPTGSGMHLRDKKKQISHKILRDIYLVRPINYFPSPKYSGKTNQSHTNRIHTQSSSSVEENVRMATTSEWRQRANGEQSTIFNHDRTASAEKMDSFHKIM